MAAFDFKDREGRWVTSFSNKQRKTFHTRIGQSHADMKKRCTPNSPEQLRHNHYIGCEMSEDFKDVQKFGDWLSVQIGYENVGWNLDKDILVRDNKLYSAETCLLVPNCLNKFLTKRQVHRGELPIGVTWKAKNRAYCAAITMQGNTKHIGLYSNPLVAFMAYKETKENEAKRLADFWRGKIDDRACEALLNYEVLISD